MLKEIKISEAIGKVLKGFEFSIDSDQMLIIFDDAFTTIGIEKAYESCDDAIKQDKIETSNFRDENLIQQGIFIKKELQEKRDRQDKIWYLMREKEDLKTYNKLKLKFEKK